MAGVGFELKKLFNQRGLLSNLSGYVYSALVTVGPVIFCIGLIFFVQYYLIKQNVRYSSIELLLATIVYSFIFSQILTSGFLFVLSRFISDHLYLKRYESIIQSFYGSQVFILILSAIAGLFFYWNSPLPLLYKILAYCFFVVLCQIWLEMIYLSAVKDYIRIVLGFTLSCLLSMVFTLVLKNVYNIDLVSLVLLSVDAGFLIVMIWFATHIKSFYGTSTSNMAEFLIYIEKFYPILITGFFLTLAPYVHNFVFWVSPHRIILGKTYAMCSLYDVPTFFAVLTIIPTMVLFVVSVETNFYQKYRGYYSNILKGSTITEIQMAKKEMNEVVFQEINHIAQIQFFIVLIAFILGVKFLPMVGFNKISTEIFFMLVLGGFGYINMFIAIMLLFYFDDRKGTFLISFCFLVLNLGLTILSVELGESFYGTGYFLASFISYIIALERLSYVLRNIDYFTFCSQPLWVNESAGPISRMVRRLDEVGATNEKQTSDEDTTKESEGKGSIDTPRSGDCVDSLTPEYSN
ncbi:MAG: exopolysaccharide Pel transporter PelG [Chitinophagales bacterium]